MIIIMCYKFREYKAQEPFVKPLQLTRPKLHFTSYGCSRTKLRQVIVNTLFKVFQWIHFILSSYMRVLNQYFKYGVDIECKREEVQPCKWSKYCKICHQCCNKHSEIFIVYLCVEMVLNISPNISNYLCLIFNLTIDKCASCYHQRFHWTSPKRIMRHLMLDMIMCHKNCKKLIDIKDRVGVIRYNIPFLISVEKTKEEKEELSL